MKELLDSFKKKISQSRAIAQLISGMMEKISSINKKKIELSKAELKREMLFREVAKDAGILVNLFEFFENEDQVYSEYGPLKKVKLIDVFLSDFVEEILEHWGDALSAISMNRRLRDHLKACKAR